MEGKHTCPDAGLDRGYYPECRQCRVEKAAPALLKACRIWVEHVELHEKSEHPKANMFCTECPDYVNTFKAAISLAEKGE